MRRNVVVAGIAGLSVGVGVGLASAPFVPPGSRYLVAAGDDRRPRLIEPAATDASCVYAGQRHALGDVIVIAAINVRQVCAATPTGGIWLTVVANER